MTSTTVGESGANRVVPSIVRRQSAATSVEEGNSVLLKTGAPHTYRRSEIPMLSMPVLPGREGLRRALLLRHYVTINARVCKGSRLLVGGAYWDGEQNNEPVPLQRVKSLPEMKTS